MLKPNNQALGECIRAGNDANAIPDHIIGSGASPILCPTMPNTSASLGATRRQPKRMDTPVIAYPYLFLCRAHDRAFRAIVCANTEATAVTILLQRVAKMTRVYRIAQDEFLSDPLLLTIGEPQWTKDHTRAALPAPRWSRA